MVRQIVSIIRLHGSRCKGEPLRTWGEIEQVAEIEVPEVVRRCVPTCDKVIIVVEMPARKTKGGVIKPDEVIEKEKGGSGWVVSLGPDAGHILCAASGISDRDNLRGIKVGFGKFAGDALAVHDTDEGFKGRFRMIPEDRILWVFDVDLDRPARHLKAS